MATATVRAGFEAFVKKANPSKNFASTAGMVVQADAAASYLFFNSPVKVGATVTSARLTVYAKGASSGSRTLTLVRNGGSWKESKITWKVRPDGTGVASTASVGALTDGQAVTFDVTRQIQALATGSKNYGFKITSSAGAAHKFYGFKAANGRKPTLVVSWSDAPAKPTGLRPSDAATSLALPYVKFDYRDYGGNTVLAKVRVQVQNTAGTTTLLDTGEVATAGDSGLDLSDFSASWAGLTPGQEVRWRVIVRDGAGLASPWSDWVTMKRADKGTVTITNLGSGKVLDLTPPITWTFSKPQKHYQVRLFNWGDMSRVLKDSKMIAGTADDYTIPAGWLKDNGRYTVQVLCYDDQARESTPGDPVYSSAVANFTVDADATQAAPVLTSAAPVGDTPWIDLTWTRATMPDHFEVYRGGELILSAEAPDVFVSGTTYRWRYYGAKPNTPQVFTVRAKVNGVRSAASASRTVTTSPSGIWVVNLSRGVNVTLWGNDEGSWNATDDADVHVPVGSSQPVRIVNGLRGHEGTISGLLMSGFGKTFEAMEADLWEIKGDPTSTYRLILGDENFECLIGNVRITPKPETRKGERVKGVSFDFWQVGDLPFDLA